MSEKINLHGSCLCGAVNITLDNIEPHVDACHCGMCQKWCGGPGMTIRAGDKIDIGGKDNITTFTSSEWAERAFCSSCGSNLYYQLQGQDLYFVYAGLFANDERLKLEMQIFIDHKPDFYHFAEKTKMMTEAEVVAAFSSE